MILRIILIMFFGFLTVHELEAQDKLVLSGRQIKTGKDKVKFVANPVYITSSYVITSVEGDTCGFWIENGHGLIVKSFKRSSDAIGFRLTKGQYKVIPNLPPGKQSANIIVYLQVKTK